MIRQGLDLFAECMSGELALEPIRRWLHDAGAADPVGVDSLQHLAAGCNGPAEDLNPQAINDTTDSVSVWLAEGVENGLRWLALVGAEQ